MTQPTKEQWAALERGLFGSYGRAELRVDGYALTLRKVLVAENKLEITIYVDGRFRYEWITTDCEERRRFMRPVRSKVYTGKHRKAIEKIGKRMRKELGIDIDRASTRYMPFWPTFAPLRRHQRARTTPSRYSRSTGRRAMNKWIPTTDLLLLRRMGKLQEECGELLEVTGRVIIQGINEIDPGTGVVNRERLTKEIADVYAQLDETAERLGLDAEFIAERRAHKRSLMADWEALFNE